MRALKHLTNSPLPKSGHLEQPVQIAGEMNDPSSEATSPHESPEAEILPILRQRWSPYTFSGRPVKDEQLKSILEAGRWSPSSYNEQPWAYIVARKSDEELYKKVLSCLVDQNQAWAKYAPVLILSFARTTFEKNGKENPHARHDVGAAAAYMTVQAASHGLFVHQMAGINEKVIRDQFSIPDTHEPVAGMALGYFETSPTEGMADFVERDQSPDVRRSLGSSFFDASWGHPHPVIQ